MSEGPGARAWLETVGALADDAVELGETALVLASLDRPGVLLDPYRRHLQRLVREVADYAGDDARDDIRMRWEALRRVVARRYGYGGGDDDAWEEWDGTNLTRVIDQRAGLPLVLGVIYLHVARALGWEMEGLDFPARFLVRLDLGPERLILDPFEGLVQLGPPEMRALLKAVIGNHAELLPDHYRSLTNREILLRIQNTIKLRRIRAGRLEDALEKLNAMLLFAPGEKALWREVGLIHARLDHVEEAVAALEEYLRHDTSDNGRYRATVLLQELRSRLQC